MEKQIKKRSLKSVMVTLKPEQKTELVLIAKENGLPTSTLSRIIIDKFLKEVRKTGVRQIELFS